MAFQSQKSRFFGFQILDFFHFAASLIDHFAKGGLTQFSGTFYHDSLRAKIFKTLIISLFEDIWVSN